MKTFLRYLMPAVFLSGCILPAQDDPVTVVKGESWLNHLHREFNDTSMGKTGRIGPPPPTYAENTARGQTVLSIRSAQALTLHGSDLYRLNCQGCHGESGLGAPPEINSVINPVRATSRALIMERMKNAGMDITRADAAKLAQQANTALLQRLHDGGQDMPAFPHLNQAEIGTLVAYLKQLAEVPGAKGEQIAIKESPVRVGEHIAKSTCHTCHSAAGPDPTPQQLLNGAIPPLSTLTARVSQAEFVRKVTQGAPIFMGTPPLLYRGRMPVFYYLSEEEAADTYRYLTSYPPSESANPEPTVALAQAALPGGDARPPLQGDFNKSVTPGDRSAEAPDPDENAYLDIALPSVMAIAAFLLLAAGLGLAVHESKGPRAKSERRRLAAASGRETVDQVGRAELVQRILKEKRIA